MNGTPRTKAQLGLDQIFLLRIADRHATASGCGNGVTVARFWLKMAVRALAAPWSVFGTLGGGGTIHQYPVDVRPRRCPMVLSVAHAHACAVRVRAWLHSGERDISGTASSCA
eukprot:4610219-Prymnesium_polylepis.3